MHFTADIFIGNTTPPRPVDEVIQLIHQQGTTGVHLQARATTQFVGTMDNFITVMLASQFLHPSEEHHLREEVAQILRDFESIWVMIFVYDRPDGDSEATFMVTPSVNMQGYTLQ